MKASQRLVDLIDEARDARADTTVQSSPSGANVEASGPLLEQFLEQVDEACDERYRTHHGEVELVRQLLDTFEFVRERAQDTVSVRVVPIRGRNGSGEGNSVLEVVTADHPFIVDTINLFLDFTGMQVVSSAYATLRVERDANGRLVACGPSASSATREVLARFEIAGRLDDVFETTIIDAVSDRLRVTRSVVSDFEPMKDRLTEMGRGYVQSAAEVASQIQIVREVQGLLEWLQHDNFILMGLSHYGAELTEDSEDHPAALESWGYASVSPENRLALRDKVRDMRDEARYLDNWVVTYKSQEESLVHRAGKIDNFVFKSFDESGEHDGYYHLRGLFTFKAIQTLGGQLPFVKLKLAKLLRRAGYTRGSIKWKAFTNAFNSIPVEYLFEAQPDEIAEIIDTILYVEQSRELRTHVVVDEESRKGLYFLVLPRQGYSEGLRNRIESILIEGLGATYSDSRVYFGKFDTVLLTFFFTATQTLKSFSREQLDERVRSVAGTWDDRFQRVLVRLEGAERAAELFARYREAFPEDYQLVTPPTEAAVDVQHLESIRIADDRDISFAIIQGEHDLAQGMARLRVYLRDNVYLSSLLPVLDDFGLQIVDQAAFRVRPSRERELFTQTFRIAGVHEDSALLERTDDVVEALEMVFSERVDTDLLNRLIVDVGIGWRDVNLIRAYVNYMRQLGVGNTFAFMSNTFAQNVEVTQLLLQHYRTRFDPDLKVTRKEKETELEARTRLAAGVEEEVLAALQRTPSQAQDTFLRRLLNLFTSTLRTTRYQEEEPGQAHRLSIKIDSQALVMGSEPRPWREIFVHHYGTEGIHIRGGRLARGGIRWSDRLSDYREEVLGLMRTQMVKNVLIVPVGAKGGFVVRRPEADRDARQAQAEEMYRIYINALLDVTDNAIDGAVVHPPRVLCYDGEDPYMVVAADKGTAHLSDTANEISQSRSFWLGDAFASGGKNGYDHKALGITARGAWECVRRHFLELGVDPEKDVISAVGVGDMSGDVFGNGMLCSRTIQLKAAFNHLHIFIDPDPDPTTSFQERLRLFRMPRSTWQDYDPKVMSKGAGVYDRNAKTITIEPEAARWLELDELEQRPQDVIQAILRSKIDLFWNGGIGTYIKSSSEDNRDVGDLANVAVRVNSKEVRARVLGEGGNLGITQRGRIDLALRGVRLNTDFVDNSAGVNCSDHEVNIKILLEGETKSGRLTEELRNQWLAKLSDPVCQSVLRSNYDQALAISLDEVRSRRDVFAFERALKSLEDRSVVDRVTDHMPDLETLFNRAAKGQGLVRPELATLNAYTKMEVYRRLLEAPADAIPGLEDYLIAYFPDRLVELCGQRYGDHLLAREIAMTVVTNLFVDHAGVSFSFDSVRESGSELAEVVRAYLVLDEIFQAWGMKQAVLALDGSVDTLVQYDALLAVEETLHRSVSWVVGGREGGRLARIERDQALYSEYLKEYEAVLPEGLSNPEQKRYRETLDRYYDAGFTIGLPDRLAKYGYLPAGLRIVDICLRSDAPVPEVARLYFKIGQSSQIFPLVRLCDDKTFAGRWDSLALRIIRNSLLDSLWSLTRTVVGQLGSDVDDTWVDRGLALARERSQFAELRKELRTVMAEEISIAALQVVSVRLSQAFDA